MPTDARESRSGPCYVLYRSQVRSSRSSRMAFMKTSAYTASGCNRACVETRRARDCEVLPRTSNRGHVIYCHHLAKKRYAVVGATFRGWDVGDTSQPQMERSQGHPAQFNNQIPVATLATNSFNCRLADGLKLHPMRWCNEIIFLEAK